MSQLELYLPATYENILALLLASAFAMELCKPSLCWVMISTAAGLVSWEARRITGRAFANCV